MHDPTPGDATAMSASGGRIEELVVRLRADPGAAAILCDVDGTLAPVVEDPEAAAVPEQVRSLLRELARRYALVGCVSGRRASAARRIVGVEELYYAGNHGLEFLGPHDVEPRLDPALGRRGGAARSFADRLDERMLEGAGLELEDKGPIQAIHWRRARDQELAERRAREIAKLIEHEGLQPHFGRKVLEVRPVAEIHKGTAVRGLLDDHGEVTRALYAGDDRTDVDAFAALRAMAREGKLEQAVTVAVASGEAPTGLTEGVDAVVDGPAGMVELLRALGPAGGSGGG